MFLPTTREEMARRGWKECDVILVTPDCYVDHPSFAMAVLGRLLEHHGYRVGIITQPRWRDPRSFLSLGIPRIAFAVSGGNADSMVLNYTASLKPRKTDAYCEDGNPFFSVPGKGKKYRIRPDRVVTVFCSQIRSVCRDRPLIIGGIEASLRRIAHYDVWSDSVRRSVLFDAKAEALVYGMGEYTLLDLVRQIEAQVPFDEMAVRGTAVVRRSLEGLEDFLALPSFDEVRSEEEAFARAFCRFIENGDKKILVQQQDTRHLVQFPRREITQADLDRIYALPFERRPHPRFRNIPAYTMIKNSVTAHRGCYGNCSFCAITAHQGTMITSRSTPSILEEVRRIAAMDDFSGTISDIGGPSANMYGSHCRIGGCDHPDCLKDGGCQNLVPGTTEYLRLLDAARSIEGVRHVFIGSGIRYDPPLMDEAFLSGLLHAHISGQMKVGVESGSDRVLAVMNKPGTEIFDRFKELFDRVSARERTRRYLIPYIIVGHPGEGEQELDETRMFLDRHHLRGHQFQIFTPSPLTRATAMFYLGFDPCTGIPVHVERRRRELERRKRLLLSKT